MARALSRAHEKGIAHRDLKPSNIFIVHEGPDEIIKLLDFGIAKRFGEFSELTDGFRTKTGLILGTPHYVSPEQAMGRTDIDHRVDVWAARAVARDPNQRFESIIDAVTYLRVMCRPVSSQHHRCSGGSG